MARIVLTNVEVTIGAVDLSNHIASVTLGSTYDVVETTAFAGGNVPAAAKTRQAGLVDNSVTFEFHQDFAPGELEAYINSDVAADSLLGTEMLVKLIPASGGVGVSNPGYTFSCIVSEWTPLNGAVGELATVSVTWPITGKIEKIVA